jgi:hypothetical protein
VKPLLFSLENSFYGQDCQCWTSTSWTSTRNRASVANGQLRRPRWIMYALTPACCHGLPERASGSDSECPILDNHEMPTIFAARSITCEHSLRHLARRRCILKSERRAGQLAMFANRRNSAAAALRIGYFSSMGHLQRNRGAQLNWPVLQTTERCPALRRRLAMFRRGRPGPNRRSRPNWLCSHDCPIISRIG